MRMQFLDGGNVVANPQTSWRRSVAVDVQDRRREPRAALEFSIEVSGFDRFGRFHTEFTKTSNVSLMGCCFHLYMEVEKGLVLALSVVHPKGLRELGSRPVLFQIVRIEPRPDGNSVGVLRLQAENPWVDYFADEDDPGQPAD
jgi:hypothetical protein